MAETHNVSQKMIDDLDDLLENTDDDCVRFGKPILSVMVRHHETGQPGRAFWRAVRKYKLRRSGESDAMLVNRLTQDAYNYHIGGLVSAGTMGTLKAVAFIASGCYEGILHL